MLSKKDIGNQGEDTAATYLRSKGYRIIEQNVRTRYGEVDLIARQGNKIFFVEIKTRTGPTYGQALDAITPDKIRKMTNTAQALINKHKEWQTLIPFLSVLAIDYDLNGDPHIEFLPNAVE
ncbi:MAG: hypothetical protein ACD_62C00542G0001 [uncultured bacterium]|nr:MAG: hypothetical protein ACD_62C00542G0001 [uncultured bacterium]HLD44349.1 YraN family protein [bacterium]